MGCQVPQEAQLKLRHQVSAGLRAELSGGRPRQAIDSLSSSASWRGQQLGGKFALEMLSDVNTVAFSTVLVLKYPERTRVVL